MKIKGEAAVLGHWSIACLPSRIKKVRFFHAAFLKGNNMNGIPAWFNLVNFYLELDDLVQPLLSREQNEEYGKLRRLMRLHVDFLREGIEEFSWATAHKKGWLSRDDYEKRFVEELKGFDWRNWKPDKN